MPATLADDSFSPLGVAVRAMGLALLGLAATLAFFFAAIAAAVIGLVVAACALALRLAPRRRVRDTGPVVLDAQRTPSGWVVETASRR